MTDRLTDKHIQHLYWRTGFGITSETLTSIRGHNKKEIIDQIFRHSTSSNPLSMDFDILVKNQKDLSPEERKKLRKLRRTKMHELNLLWFNQLTNTDNILREKMTLFFHDHFSVRLKMPRACIHLNNVIRKHALGNFGEMLMEVSKSPAMLLFLNNRQNRKNHPNENFAREVMELFTLGRDNGYTETDIKESARAFTGWNFDKEGTFVFRQKHHDFESKTIFGKTGNFKGEDVIKMLLSKKQTARYITEKIYQYFVNPNSNSKHIEELTTIFYNSNYDIKVLLQAVFESDWFYNSENIGSKIKSPIELLVGLSRTFDIKYENPKVLLYLQRKLNQTLFFPPNVAGWPGGKAWIDNSTLMLRLKLTSILLNNGVIEWNEKGDMPENMITKQKHYNKIRSRIQKKVKATPNWNNFLATLEHTDNVKLTHFMLQPQVSNAAKNVVSNLDTTNTKNFVIELLSLPEYQLC